jgi:hypothetical protein
MKKILPLTCLAFSLLPQTFAVTFSEIFCCFNCGSAPEENQTIHITPPYTVNRNTTGPFTPFTANNHENPPPEEEQPTPTEQSHSDLTSHDNETPPPGNQHDNNELNLDAPAQSLMYASNSLLQEQRPTPGSPLRTPSGNPLDEQTKKNVEEFFKNL